MNESKTTLYDRWRRDGRWPEVSKFMKTVRAECKERGLNRAEAAAAAWDAAEKAFPPLAAETAPKASRRGSPDAEPPMDSEASPVALGAESDAEAVLGDIGDQQPAEPPPADSFPVESAEKSTSDQAVELWGELPGTARYEDQVEWVSANYGLVVEEGSKGVRIRLDKALEPPPSHAAVNLLTWAAGNKAGFWKEVYPKVKRGQGQEDELVRRDKMQVDDIKKILAQFDQKSEEELIADVSGTVRKDIRELVSGWLRRFGIDLPNEARKSLEAHIAELVQHSIEGIGRASERDEKKRAGAGG